MSLIKRKLYNPDSKQAAVFMMLKMQRILKTLF